MLHIRLIKNKTRKVNSNKYIKKIINHNYSQLLTCLSLKMCILLTYMYCGVMYCRVMYGGVMYYGVILLKVMIVMFGWES